VIGHRPGVGPAVVRARYLQLAQEFEVDAVVARGEYLHQPGFPGGPQYPLGERCAERHDEIGFLDRLHLLRFR
jgi:hypothetical protein